MVTCDEPTILMPAPLAKSRITILRTIDPEPETFKNCKPSATPAEAPEIVTLLPKLLPSIVTTVEIAGSAVLGVIISWVGARKNSMLSPDPEFASRIACRSEPIPESALVVTERTAKVPDQSADKSPIA